MIEVSNPICTQPNELTSVCYLPIVTAMLFTKANIRNQHVSVENTKKILKLCILLILCILILICIYAYVVKHITLFVIKKKENYNVSIIGFERT